MNAEFATVALLIAGYALFAARLDRFSIGPALAFIAIGILLSDDALGWITVEPEAEPVKLLAEATLTLLLFSDASTIRIQALRRDAAAVSRLLVIGLLLSIALGAVLAGLLFPGVSMGIALLIGAALAPTDAALGQAVVTDRAVPARVRRILSIESGLNDGIATPFVILAIALATAEGTSGSGWLGEAIRETVIGIGAGVLVGLSGGLLLRVADARRWTSETSRQLFVLALAISCYLVATSAGGNGFIGAFVGGLAFGRGSQQHEASAVRFTETQGSMLAIGVWAAFGLTLAGHLLTDLWDIHAVVYAVLSLTVVRMVPVAIALIGARFARRTVLFMGWFGPRGLASIVFLVIGLEGLQQAGVDPGPLSAAVAWTVLLSVVLHSLSARPLASRYGRLMAALPPDAPELDGDAEPQPSRTPWVGSRAPS